jgi:tetratricopeptide (TPR) repeat protein
MSNQVTIDSVLWAYRLLLDRDPENLEIIEEKIAKFTTNQELVRDLINSPEFSSKQSSLLLTLLGNTLEAVGQSLKSVNDLERPILNESIDELNHQSNIESLLKITQIATNLGSDPPPNIPQQDTALLCAELGAKAKEEGNLVDADVYYQKALQKNPSLPESIYLEFKTIQEKLGQKEESLATYKKWIEKEYLVEHNSKIIYCPIAKNACTLLKNVLIELSDRREDFKTSDLKIHKYIDSHKHIFQLDCFDYINREDYFKFIILRNPFKRVISTYADKFVNRLQKNDPHAIPVIEEIYQDLGLPPDFNKSITFTQFVDYLLKKEDCQLDSHWRPQSVYFAAELVKFDYIGQFENLAKVIEELETKLNVKMDAGVSKHRTTYSKIVAVEEFHNLYPQELKTLETFPQSSQFYTEELEDKIRARYSQDINIYEESFGVKLPPMNPQ